MGTHTHTHRWGRPKPPLPPALSLRWTSSCDLLPVMPGIPPAAHLNWQLPQPISWQLHDVMLEPPTWPTNDPTNQPPSPPGAVRLEGEWSRSLGDVRKAWSDADGIWLRLVPVTSGLTHTSVLCRWTHLLTGEVLPGLVGLPEVDGPLQNPEVRTGRVGELDQHVGDVEELQRHREEEHFTLKVIF